MTDLVVVGAGNAGLVAAATAAEVGLDAIVVEKTERAGGMLHWSSGHFSAAGTARQRERGIDDHPDLHYRDIMTVSHELADPLLVRLAVDAAPETVDWLQRLGFDFAPDAPSLVSGHELYSRPRTYWGGATPRDGGRALLEVLLPASQAGGVEFRFSTSVERLELAAGRPAIRGIVARDDHGESFLAADTVILATGGYAANRGMLERLQPAHSGALTGCLEHATGDGHLMLEELGVNLTHGDTYAPTMGMIEDPSRPGFGLHISRIRLIVNANDRPPWEVWVNSSGRRFVAEDTRSPFVREEALREQPGLEMWAVWDQAIFDAAPPVIGPDWTRERIVSEGLESGWLVRGDTIDELAGSMRVPPSHLVDTIETYNSASPDPLGRGHRPLPIGRAPFYAVRTVGGMLLSRAGPVVNDRLQPMLASGEPIHGLFAVGELLGMGRFSGDSFAGGMSVGPAMALARKTVLDIALERGLAPSGA